MSFHKLLLTNSITTWLAFIMMLVVIVAGDNATQPIAIFRSVCSNLSRISVANDKQRPDLQAPILTPLHGKHNVSKMAPGYFFVAPYQQLQNGIYIYDNYANLIYSGFGSAGPGVSHSPQTCKYKGEIHLCFYQGVQMVGWGHGHGIIMDKHYHFVKSVQPTGSNQASSDMHEFRLIDEGRRALMTQYLRTAYDLCDWDLCDGLAYIQQGVFQEIDVETGKNVFTWHSLDHIHPSESYVDPATTEISGDGRSPTSPWDYFHINSIDKNDNGDYLISARHVSAIYKISATDGSVVWRLGGVKSDFALEGFSFSFQHDARFISDSKEETVVSLFDNGSNGFNTTEPFSSGLIIRIDHSNKTARVIRKVDSPGDGHLSRSQGSYQILPNGNEVMGWGSDAFWSEHTPDGEVVFYGMVGTENVMNYRVHKFDDWVGIPLTKPAFWTYSQYGYEDMGSRESYEGKSNTNPMMLYASWNGHTQIVRWAFFCSSSNSRKSFKEVGELRKNGFETIYRHETTYRYCYAEARDSNNQRLGESDIVQTFVPNGGMRTEYCDELACRFIPDDETRERENAEKANSIDQESDEETVTEESSPEDPEEEASDAGAASNSPPSSRSALFVVSWALLGSVTVAILLTAARNYLSASWGNEQAILIMDRIMFMTGLQKMRRKASSAAYHAVEDESDDEEGLVGHLHEEANQLMRRKDEAEVARRREDTT